MNNTIYDTYKAIEDNFIKETGIKRDDPEFRKKYSEWIKKNTESVK